MLHSVRERCTLSQVNALCDKGEGGDVRDGRGKNVLLTRKSQLCWSFRYVRAQISLNYFQLLIILTHEIVSKPLGEMKKLKKRKKRQIPKTGVVIVD